MDELLGSRCTPATRGAWLKEKWPELLDAHYQCQVPGPSACLQDALNMITTGKVRITCPGAKKEEGKEARTMSELEKHVIKEWYDAKDTELVEKMSETCLPRRARITRKTKRTTPRRAARWRKLRGMCWTRRSRCTQQWKISPAVSVSGWTRSGERLFVRSVPGICPRRLCSCFSVDCRIQLYFSDRIKWGHCRIK